MNIMIWEHINCRDKDDGHGNCRHEDNSVVPTADTLTIVMNMPVLKSVIEML